MQRARLGIFMAVISQRLTITHASRGSRIDRVRRDCRIYFLLRLDGHGDRECSRARGRISAGPAREDSSLFDRPCLSRKYSHADGPAVSGGYRLALEKRADDKLIKIVRSRNAERFVSFRAPPVFCKLESRFFLLNYDSLIYFMLFYRIRRGDFVGYACIRDWDDYRREDHVRLSSSQHRQDCLFLVRFCDRKDCSMQCEWQAFCPRSMDGHLAAAVCQDFLAWQGSFGDGQDFRVRSTARRF